MLNKRISQSAQVYPAPESWRTLLRMDTVPNRADFWSKYQFNSGKWRLSTNILKCVEIAPRAPITIGMTLVLIFHRCSTSILKSPYFEIFSLSFSLTLLSAGIKMSTNDTSFLTLSTIVMSGLRALTTLSQYMLKSHKILTKFVSTTVASACFRHSRWHFSANFLHRSHCM